MQVFNTKLSAVFQITKYVKTTVICLQFIFILLQISKFCLQIDFFANLKQFLIWFSHQLQKETAVQTNFLETQLQLCYCKTDYDAIHT